MIIKLNRFVRHCKGIFWYYRFKEVEPYYNETTKSVNVYVDCWYIGIQLITGNDKWFGYEELYYDGMTAKVITILGVKFIKGYDYEWEDLGTQIWLS